MTASTDLIRGIISASRIPPLLYSPPELNNPIIIDFNPPTSFRGGFSQTSGRVYYPEGEDVSWIPGGFTKVAISATAPSNGRLNLATDTVYVFAPTNSLDVVTGYAYRTYRINSQSIGAAVRDVLILLPESAPLPHEINTDGGVNIRMIGGKIVGSFPPDPYSGYIGPTSNTRAVFRASNVKSSIYIEGVILDANNLFGLDAYEVGVNNITGSGYTPTCYIQNVMCINTTSDVSTGLHADGYQLYGPSAINYICNCTFIGNYQNLFLDQQSIVGGFKITDVNCRYTDPVEADGYSFYLLSNLDTPTNSGNPSIMPVDMKNVYIEARSSSDWDLTAIYPPSNIEWGCVLNRNEDRATFPQLSMFTGYVKKGYPPNGDIVRPENIGVGYVSPGYR